VSTRLTPARVRLLTEIIRRRNAAALAHVEAVANGRLSMEGREVLLDLLSAELVERGLDTSDEPTGWGVVVEDLTDMLAAE
jgi:hypothetical protein